MSHTPNGAEAILELLRTNGLAPTPDYAKLAEAYGGFGERVESAAALEPAIDRAPAALAAGRPALLDVFLTGVAEGKWQG
jgi:acetolactate synthase-1/2/3 large subunit